MRLDDLKTMRVSVANRIATLTLDNPDALNAVGPDDPKTKAIERNLG